MGCDFAGAEFANLFAKVFLLFSQDKWIEAFDLFHRDAHGLLLVFFWSWTNAEEESGLQHARIEAGNVGVERAGFERFDQDVARAGGIDDGINPETRGTVAGI